MIKQSLEQKLQQKLAPQQLQVVRLLEIPASELEDCIKQELIENPTLEEGEESSDNPDHTETTQESRYTEDIPDYKLNTYNHSSSDNQNIQEIPIISEKSLHELLQEQMALKLQTDKQESIAQQLIGTLDGDGYLRRELIDLVDDLAFFKNIECTEEEVEEVLHIIQGLDPAGIGARNLQECLLLQIERLPDTELNRLAHLIISKHFENFSKRHFPKIIKQLNCTKEQLQAVIGIIVKLDPRPGSSIDASSKPAQVVSPDFLLDVVDGELRLELNQSGFPQLRISSSYSQMLNEFSKKKEFKNKEEESTIQFIRQKIDSANWFIQAVKQRQETLRTTMLAILSFQQDFFMEGDKRKLRPMILKDIAQITGYDISTISRVSNSKYIQTHFGIFPLREFFSESIATVSGEDVSTEGVKLTLSEIIENEDKKKPITDHQLTAILQEKGYKIARRTVAKYREQLKYPVARLRIIP